MRALITGGAGFIGSHLAEELVENGYKVIILDNLSTGKLQNIHHLIKAKKIKFIEGSILENRLVKRLIKEVDVVFHLAAVVGVKRVIEYPLDVIKVNITGTENVCQAVRKYSKKMLFVSSSAVYGKNGDNLAKEDSDSVFGSPLRLYWSYSTTKTIGEVLTHSYCKEYIIVRLFNTIGPRQVGTYGMVVPKFIQQALNNEAITIYGDGTQSRCFIYVKDIVKAIRQLVEKPEAYNQVYNIGSQEQITIEELAQKIFNIFKQGSIKYIPYSEAYGDKYEDIKGKMPDLTKIKGMIDFKITYSLNESINNIVDEITDKIIEKGGK